MGARAAKPVDPTTHHFNDCIRPDRAVGLELAVPGRSNHRAYCIATVPRYGTVTTRILEQVRMASHSLVLVLSVVLVGCGGGDAGMTVSPTPQPPVVTNVVDVSDNRFEPMTITAALASAVTWTWRGSGQHNVTFEDAQGSSSTRVAGTHQRAFAVAGTYRYRCTIHSTNFASGMVGIVTVP